MDYFHQHVSISCLIYFVFSSFAILFFFFLFPPILSDTQDFKFCLRSTWYDFFPLSFAPFSFLLFSLPLSKGFYHLITVQRVSSCRFFSSFSFLFPRGWSSHPPALFCGSSPLPKRNVLSLFFFSLSTVSPSKIRHIFTLSRNVFHWLSLYHLSFHLYLRRCFFTSLSLIQLPIHFSDQRRTNSSNRPPQKIFHFGSRCPIYQCKS